MDTVNHITNTSLIAILSAKRAAVYRAAAGADRDLSADEAATLMSYETVMMQETATTLAEAAAQIEIAAEQAELLEALGDLSPAEAMARISMIAAALRSALPVVADAAGYVPVAFALPAAA